MRCRECNVDLPEKYTACPLCGAKAYSDEPKIGGIRHSEYPEVQTEKYVRNPFPVFLMIWALVSAVSFVLFKKETVDANLFSLLVSIVPMVWTLVLRPIHVKQLYFGNYAVVNLYPAALCGFIYCLIKGALNFYFVSFLPAVFILVLFALLVIVFARPKVSKRAAPYFVLSLAVSIVAEIGVAVSGYDVLNAWLVVMLVCILSLVFLLCKSPEETKEEIKAKFSIQ